MNLLETELRELAQTHLELIQDIQWHDLRRAVVMHLESLEEQDTLIIPRVNTRLSVSPRHQPKALSQMEAMEHRAGQLGTQSFFRFLKTANPNGSGCHANPSVAPTNDPAESDTNKAQLSCTAPNCLRSHAPHWLYAELWAFRWWVQHEFNTGLATGYTLDGDLIGMSTRTANLTLATMPYVDEGLLPQVQMACTDPTAGDLRRHDCHCSQQTSQPPQWTAPQRQSFDTTVGTTHPGGMSLPRDQLSSESIPLQIQHQPQRPIHGFPEKITGKRTPGQEPNENMPNNKKLELRPKLHRHLLLMRLQNQTLVHQWHPPSTRHVNIGLTRLLSPEPFETLRQTAGSTVQSIPASVPTPSSAPVSNELNQIAAQADTNPMTQSLMEPDQWLPRYTFSTKDPGQHFGSMVRETTDPIYPPVATNTYARHAVTLARRQQFSNWTVSSSPSFTSLLQNHYPVSMGTWGTILQGNMISTGPRPSTLWSPSADTHGIPKHRQQTPLCSSFGGTNISDPDSQECCIRKISPTVVQGLPSYQIICRPFFWPLSNLMKLARPVGPPYETSSTRRSGLGLLSWDLAWHPARHNDDGHERWASPQDTLANWS